MGAGPFSGSHDEVAVLCPGLTMSVQPEGRGFRQGTRLRGLPSVTSPSTLDFQVRWIAPRRGPAPGQAGAWGHLRVQGAWLGSTRGCHSWSQAPRPSPGPAQPGRAQGPEGGPTVPKDTPSPVRPARLGVWESQPPRVRAQAQAGGSLPEVKSHWAPALPLCELSLSGPLSLWPPLLPTPSGMDKPGRLHPAPQLPRAPPN